MSSSPAMIDPEVAHFLAIPWCASLLRASPSLVVGPCITRTAKPDYEEALMAQTLRTAGTIPAFAVFYEPPADPRAPLAEVGALLTLGPMLNGWRGVCHGGMVVTVMDEVLGQIPALSRMRGALPDWTTMTAYLNTKFEAPVRTGEGDGGKTVLVRARLVRHDGRKMWIEGAMEDEKGRVLARAEALFVQIREKL